MNNSKKILTLFLLIGALGITSCGVSNPADSIPANNISSSQIINNDTVNSSSSRTNTTNSTNSYSSSANEDKAANTYTIRWVNYDNTELEVDKNVIEGTIPTYNGEAPTRENDDSYIYVFKGFEPVINKVSSDQVYTAKYDKVDKTFTVTWLDWNGKVLKVDKNVKKNTIPTYDKEVPTRESNDNAYYYSFEGWTPAIQPVNGDISYTAKYDKVDKTFTVTWLNWDGTILQLDKDVSYGDMPIYTGEKPQKEWSEKVAYVWNEKWSPNIGRVYGDITYTAVFTEKEKVLITNENRKDYLSFNYSLSYIKNIVDEQSGRMNYGFNITVYTYDISGHNYYNLKYTIQLKFRFAQKNGPYTNYYYQTYTFENVDVDEHGSSKKLITDENSWCNSYSLWEYNVTITGFAI